MKEEDGGSDLPDRVLLAALAGDACAMRAVIDHYVGAENGSSPVTGRSDDLTAKLCERLPRALERWAAHREKTFRDSKLEQKETACGPEKKTHSKVLTFSRWFVHERGVLELDSGGCQPLKTQSWPEAEISLVQSAVLGDRAALVALIKRFEGPVFAMLGRAYRRGQYLGDRGPEDLAQDVFVKLMKQLKSGKQIQPDKLSAWVLTITKNLLRDESRRKRRRQRLLDNRVHEDELRELVGSTIPEQFSKTKQTLRAALSELPIECSDALIRRADGESLREIAKSSGVNHNTVRSRAEKARRHIRRQLRRNPGT